MYKLLLVCLMAICSLHAAANLSQSHWRWRNNNGNETAATWKAAQDSGIIVNDKNAFRLRMEVYNSTEDDKPFDHGLQYATSKNGPWYSISDASPLNAFVFAKDNTYITNNQPTTQQLTGTQYTFFPGNVITNQSAFTDTIRTLTSREYEWNIKATSLAQPSTNYFFRSASGDAPATPPYLKTGTSFTAAPNYVPNSGFENNLNGWTGTTANGSAATFASVTTEHHSGKKAAQVTVTNSSSTNSVKLSSAAGAAPNGLYILRFWAIANLRNALMEVNLKSSAGDNKCSFKIYDRFDTEDKTAWQMYQYAFRVTASPVTLEFTFNTNTTYFIDDVQVIPAADANTDVKTHYNWQYNQTGFGWLSGDNDNSVLLPDSSVAWIFSDSFVGTPDAHSNIVGSSPPIINNLIVHEENDQYTTIYKGSSSNPQSLFSPGNGNVFWNSGGVVENNKLKVMLIEIAGGNYANNLYVGTLSLPNLTVEGQVKTSYHGSNSPNTIFQDGAYNYIYVGEQPGTFENYTLVARVPVGSLSDPNILWEFYTNNNTWSTDYSNAKRILAGAVAGSVVKLGPNNYAMSAVPNLSLELAVWFATSPVGPWVNKTVVYNIPGEEGMLPYEGHIDKGSGKNGIYTLSYSVYPFSGLVPQQRSDKGIYIPYYAKANLLQLSPFTNQVNNKPVAADNATKTAVNNNASLMVFPNPVQGDIHFALNNYAGKKFKATVTAMDGKTVYNRDFTATGSNGQYTIAVRQKPVAGTYTLRVTGDKLDEATTIIVK